MTSAWVEFEHLEYQRQLAAHRRQVAAAKERDQEGSDSGDDPRSPEPGRGVEAAPPSAAGE